LCSHNSDPGEMILPHPMVYNSYQHYFTRLFTQILLIVILELVNSKGTGPVYLFFNGWKIFWSIV